jgi:hypothetical protein
MENVICQIVFGYHRKHWNCLLTVRGLNLWAVGLIFLGIGHSSDGQHIRKRKNL